MNIARQLRYSYEDYLRTLEGSDLKLEYSAGVIYARAGGTLTHASLSGSFACSMPRWPADAGS